MTSPRPLERARSSRSERGTRAASARPGAALRPVPTVGVHDGASLAGNESADASCTGSSVLPAGARRRRVEPPARVGEIAFAGQRPPGEAAAEAGEQRPYRAAAGLGRPARRRRRRRSQRVIASRSRVPSQPRRSQTLAGARWVVRFSSLLSVHAAGPCKFGDRSASERADRISYTCRHALNSGWASRVTRPIGGTGASTRITPVFARTRQRIRRDPEMSRGTSVAP